MEELDLEVLSPLGWRVQRAKAALECNSFQTLGWLSIQKSPGLLSVELMRRWALSVVRHAEARGVCQTLEDTVRKYDKILRHIEVGFSRGLGPGLCEARTRD